MSSEKIIQQIKRDSQNEIKQIKKETDSQVKNIMAEAKKQAEIESNKILDEGKKQSENIKKILISKASQDVKRESLKTKEKIIEECFVKAHHNLSTLPEDKYRKIVSMLMRDGSAKLSGKCSVVVCRDLDKKIAEELGLSILGAIDACGGIVLKSNDGKITLDNTFDGILRREKDKIRIKVGNLLFSEYK